MPPPLLPITEWKPDLPALSGGSANISNVVPLTGASYGPIGTITPYADAITARCQGSAAVLDLSGNSYLIAGDATKLYMLQAGDTAFSDVSRVAGGAYNVGADQHWTFIAFGNHLVACNIADTTQTFLLGTDTNFSTLSSGAPRARYGMVVRDFLVLANTFDGSGGDQQQRVWWSAIGDPTSWPTPGTDAAVQVQSDYQDIAGDFGPITGIAGPLGGADAVVLFQRAVIRMQYIGSPAIFSFSPALGARGTQAPGSIVQVDNRIYYLGSDDFYVFDGQSSRGLGADKWARTFWGEVNKSALYAVQSTWDPQSKLIFWGYPTGAGATSDTIDKVLAYNWALDRATTFSLSCEFLGRSLSLGLTMAQLDALGTMDTLLFPLDSAVYTGGQAIVSAFDTSHRLSYLSGDNLAATIDTDEQYPNPGGFSRVKNARAMVDGGTPTVAIGTRSRLVDTAAFGPAVAMNDMGSSPQRTTGRYITARVTVPAATSWTEMSGVEIDVEPAGTR